MRGGVRGGMIAIRPFQRAPFLAALLGALLTTAMPAAAQREPPRRLDFTREAPPPEERSEARVRDAFVRSQTVLGLVVYGPAFAALVGDDAVTHTAGYLVMAGGSFFAAAEVARRVDMTEARHRLSTHMAWRGALTMLDVTASGNDSVRANTLGGAALLGGIGGTTAGLLIAKELTPGEAMATVFGHDIAWLTAHAITFAASPDRDAPGAIGDRSRAIVRTGAGWAGYALGRLYAGNVDYHVTPGDVSALWIGTGIGATAAAALVAQSDPSDATLAVTLVTGGLLGAFVADRFLVRRIDLTPSQGRTLAFGAVAGGLMGIGIGVLAAGSADRGETFTAAMATAGAVAGVALTARYVAPARDAGRPWSVGRLTVHPLGVAALAGRASGTHAIARLTF